MKIVGLNIGKGRVAASVVEKGLRQTELKDSFSLPFASDVELVDILRNKARDWAGARVVSSIPGARFTQRTATFPFGDRKRIDKALPFEIEDSLPFALEDVVLDHIAADHAETGTAKKKETTVTGLLLSKSVLRGHLELLAPAGIDPQVVMPSTIGLLQIAKRLPSEGVTVVIGDDDLCVKDGSRVLVCRSFSPSHPTTGIRHALRAIETDKGVRVEKAVLLAESSALSAELTELGLTVERATPDLGGRKAEDAVSLGLALAELPNFRKGEFAYRIADTAPRKRRRTLIIAGAVAALLLAANIGIKYVLIQKSYGRLDKEIKEIYRQAVPDAKTVADPVRQLRVRLDESRKKFGVLGTGSSALDAMKAVTEGIPKEVRVNFQEFLLEGDRLKLSGEASSFESVDKIKAELQKAGAFAEVNVQDTRMGVDNKVKFRIEIKLKQVM